MVTMVRLGRVLGDMWCSKYPVVVPQPKQSNQAWSRENMQRNLPEGSQVCGPLPQNCFHAPEPLWLYDMASTYPYSTPECFFFFFYSHIVNSFHCILALWMYFNVQVSDRGVWRVWVPRPHPSSGRQMDIRSLPVMLLLVQPHSAVRHLLSICCQRVSTGNDKMSLLELDF